MKKVLLLVFLSYAVFCHPGRLAKDGCHKDNKNGGRHSHDEAGNEVSCSATAPKTTTAKTTTQSQPKSTVLNETIQLKEAKLVSNTHREAVFLIDGKTKKFTIMNLVALKTDSQKQTASSIIKEKLSNHDLKINLKEKEGDVVYVNIQYLENGNYTDIQAYIMSKL